MTRVARLILAAVVVALEGVVSAAWRRRTRTTAAPLKGTKNHSASFLS